jgi:Tol biopolymer transport system component
MKRCLLFLLVLPVLAAGCNGGDGGLTCEEPRTECDGLCVDTDRDPFNCGSCGTECGDGEVCFEGSCRLSCPAGLEECDGTCVDTDADRLNCGGCGTACSEGEICFDGSCRLSCPSGLEECGGTCANTQTDRNHCGECDNACGDGELCEAGSCVLSCSAGLIECDGGCIDPDSDSVHCGASGDCTGANAGEDCADDEVCLDGACVPLDPCLNPGTGTPGVTVGTPSGAAVEGGDSASYTLVLDAEPCAHVTITVTPDAQVTVDPVTLHFLPDNWDVPQTVVVSAIHDFDVEGDHTGTLTHGAASRDTGYDGIAIDDAVVAIEDRAHIEHVSIPLAGTGSDGDSTADAVSSDGRYVAFSSEAANLVLGDSGTYEDMLVRDMSSGVTHRISEGLAGEANGRSASASMSNDGNSIVFFSRATNLVSDSVTTIGEIYLHTLSTGVTTLVSGQCPTCSAYTQEMSSTNAISGDGALIAYATRRFLLTSDTDDEFDVFVYDVAAGTTSHDSLNSSDENGTNYWGSNAFGPTLSSTGQFLGFNSAARNLDTPEITVENFHAYVKDRTGRTLTRVSKHSGGGDNCDGTTHTGGSGAPMVDTTGNLAVFRSACPFTLTSGEVEDTNDMDDIFMRNITAQTTTRLSLSSAGDQADGGSTLVAISDDARYVLFLSEATNLVSGDTNAAQDLFLRDTTAGTTIRVGTDIEYGELEGGAVSAGMSRNGNYIVFATITNILASDGNTDIIDVYLLQIR